MKLIITTDDLIGLAILGIWFVVCIVRAIYIIHGEVKKKIRGKSHDS